jgi:hypothetical protein
MSKAGGGPGCDRRPTDLGATPIAAEDVLGAYDELIRPARRDFAASRGIRGMTSPGTDARTMAAFLLHFSALSIPITKPVEGWIQAAADRCTVLGLSDLGRALAAHSKAEAGHHQYHIDDFGAMLSVWNDRWAPAVRADRMTTIGITRGGKRYCEIHEVNIRGNEPFCQLSIEYEIELLPVEFGPPFLQNCVRLLGPDILQCMTFVTSHVEFDVGHTKFNAHCLGSLMRDDPRRLPALVAAGAAVLAAFGDHLTECWDRGVALASSTDIAAVPYSMDPGLR